jgi:hypothetical protein
MGRIILGIVVGFVVMRVWVMCTLYLAARLMGGPGVSAGWIVINLILSFIGAYLGGSFALRFGKEGGTVAVRGLTALVMILGLGTAVLALSGGEGGASQQPTWYNFTIPLIGAAGIMLGGRRRPSQSNDRH